MTLPSASSTAWEVKFSEGIRLMKCFWRFFSCTRVVGQHSRPAMMLASHGLAIRGAWQAAAMGEREDAHSQ